MSSKKLPQPNVYYGQFNLKSNNGEMDDTTLKGMICNPIFTGVTPYPRMVSDEAWVRAATQLIQDEGPEQFLVNMLHVLRQSLDEYLMVPAHQATLLQTNNVVEGEAKKTEYPDGTTPLYCSHDDFPMILIDGEYVCLAEYTFAHLDNSYVVDIITEPVLSLVFQNGHTLPLLCPDCQGSLHITDEDYLLNTLDNLALLDLGWDDDHRTVILEFGQAVENIYAEDYEPLEALEVHIDSIRGITCPYPMPSMDEV